MTRSINANYRVPAAVYRRVLGGLFGLMVARMLEPASARGRAAGWFPAAYRVPKIPGGTPLRLAMVHDILHERYLRHGPAWYARRQPRRPQIIAAEAAASPPSPAYLDALDDLAIGLEAPASTTTRSPPCEKKLLLLPPLPAPNQQPSRPENDRTRRRGERSTSWISTGFSPPGTFADPNITSTPPARTSAPSSFTVPMPKALAGRCPGQSRAFAKAWTSSNNRSPSIPALTSAANPGRPSHRAPSGCHRLTGSASEV